MKSNKTTITILVFLIAVLSFIAAFTGVFYSLGGEIVEVTTIRGQTLEIMKSGIYKYNSYSLVTEGGTAWDAVTLFFGIPILIISLIWFRKDSIRGSILLSGTLSYFFYQYLSYSLGWAFNQYFIVYVVIYSASLIALLLTATAIDVKKLSTLISNKFPRKMISLFLIFVGSFFMIMWLGKIIPPIINDSLPDLNGQTTLVTQSLDLGLIVPLCFASAILLIKKNVYGYLFSSIVIMKSVTMSLALVAMIIIPSIIEGSKLNIIVLSIISVMTIIGLLFAVLLIKNIKESYLC